MARDIKARQKACERPRLSHVDTGLQQRMMHKMEKEARGGGVPMRLIGAPLGGDGSPLPSSSFVSSSFLGSSALGSSVLASASVIVDEETEKAVLCQPALEAPS